MKATQKTLVFFLIIAMLAKVGCSLVIDHIDLSDFEPLNSHIAMPFPLYSEYIADYVNDSEEEYVECFLPPLVYTTIEDLQYLLGSWSDNIAVYFECLTTGFVYSKNETRRIFGASVSKAMLALQLYKMADAGEIDLDQYIRYESRHSSGGISNRYSVGTYFSIRRVIALNLYRSDNTATLMLRELLGGGNAEQGFRRYRDFVADMGGDPSLVRSRIMDSFATAQDFAIFARAINEYIEGENLNSEEFRGHLINNYHHFLFPDTVFPVASKTGWSNGVLNDMTIVYLQERPFILIIMKTGRSNRITERDRANFALIADAFVNFQRSRDMNKTYY